jgi:transcriptional regulator with XRE-family HTH domain
MARQVKKIRDEAHRRALREALESGAFSIGDACRAWRALEGVSQVELAAMAGLNVKVIKALESRAGNPRLSSLAKLAEVLGLQVALARPSYQAELLAPAARDAREGERRADEIAAIAAGRVSEQELDRNSALQVGESSYELPRLE